MSKPLVSWLVPVYNAQDFLPWCWASLQAQTLTAWEVIFVNDGSTDDSLFFLKKIAAQFPGSVRVFDQPHQGLVASLNLALAKARGEFIARADSDDLSAPQRLEQQVIFLQNNSAVDIVGSWYRTFTNYAQLKQSARLPLQKLPLTDQAIKKSLPFYDPLAHPSLLWRRSWQERVAFHYSTDFAPAEDYHAWLKFTPVTTFANLPQPLLYYQSHAGQVSQLRQAEQLRQTAKLAQRAQQELPGPGQLIASLPFSPVTKARLWELITN